MVLILPNISANSHAENKKNQNCATLYFPNFAKFFKFFLSFHPHICPVNTQKLYNCLAKGITVGFSLLCGF